MQLRNGLWLAAALLAGSCSKSDESENTPAAENPVVAFSYTSNGFVAPTQVSFTNKSKNADTYLWDFGDGTTSTEANPVHTYIDGGTYMLKLTAYNAQASATANLQLDIQPAYSKCTLVKILLDDAPFTNASGNPLDSASGPDFKVKVLYRGTSQVLVTTGTAANVTPAQLPLSFAINPVFPFPAFAQAYDVLLYDDDAPDPDELVGGYYFTLSDATTISYHYPDTMLLFEAGSKLRIKLLLDWGY